MITRDTIAAASPLNLVILAKGELDGKIGDAHRRNELTGGTNGGANFAVSACVTRAEMLKRSSWAPSTIATTTANDVADDDDGDDTPVRVYVYSYGIACTAGLLRHVYLCIYGVELHTGMTGDHSRQLVYCTRDYFGEGRCEGYMLSCEICTNKLLDDIERKCKHFFLPINNCDTIVPVIMQTSLVWLAGLSLLVGSVLSARSQNFFTFALFVPFIALLFTLLYNRLVPHEDRSECELSRCVHVSSTPR